MLNRVYTNHHPFPLVGFLSSFFDLNVSSGSYLVLLAVVDGLFATFPLFPHAPFDYG